MLHIFCGMEWAIDPEDIIEEFPLQRYTALHIDTSSSDCLIHDAMSSAPPEGVFTDVNSYRQHCGQFSVRLLY